MHDTTPLTATEAMHAHLDLIARDIERWLDLFADDAVVEFPYAASVGASGRLEGKAAIAAYFRGTPAVFHGLRFRDVRVLPVQGASAVVAEVHGSATLAPTGKGYEQDYVMVMETAGGRITRYREYWNPLPYLEGMKKHTSGEGVQP